jgi:hypothetical protein
MSPDSTNSEKETLTAELRGKKTAELREIMKRATSKQTDPNFERYGRLLAFTKAHPELHEYELYHLLNGSSPISGEQSGFDTEDHQIENFIRSLES